MITRYLVPSTDTKPTAGRANHRLGMNSHVDDMQCCVGELLDNVAVALQSSNSQHTTQNASHQHIPEKSYGQMKIPNGVLFT
jgi:hypothetical protein